MTTSNDFIICFDFGLKYIGLAIGQRITNRAKPLCTLLAKNGIPDWFFLDAIIKNWNPNQFIIGISFFYKNLKVSIKLKQFKKDLFIRYKLPIFEMDESYTTFEAKNLLKKYKKDFLKINSLSAVFILEDWLRIN